MKIEINERVLAAHKKYMEARNEYADSIGLENMDRAFKIYSEASRNFAMTIAPFVEESNEAV